MKRYGRKTEVHGYISGYPYPFLGATPLLLLCFCDEERLEHPEPPLRDLFGDIGVLGFMLRDKPQINFVIRAHCVPIGVHI